MSELPDVEQFLRTQGLLGLRAMRYGAPDSLMLISGGPLSHLSQNSILAGPASMRVLIRQPSRENMPGQVAHSPLNGEAILVEQKCQLKADIEEWAHGSWYHKNAILADDLADLFDKLRPYTTTKKFTTEISNLPSGPFWSGALAYDLVQWTQPILLQHPPNEGDVLAVLWLVERFIHQDKASGELSVIDCGNDSWSEKVTTQLQQFAPPERQQFTLESHEETSSCSDESHAQAVEAIRDSIRQGELYQLNFGRRWEGRIPDSPRDVFTRLSAANPAPFSAYIEADDLGLALASSSPETLLRSDGREVWTAPIKGTCPRGVSLEEEEMLRAEMLCDEKERSEHRMLVDLMRNDLSLDCKTGSVDVERFDVEVYANVQHLVSHLRGELMDDRTGNSTISSIFPGGSITGCPRTIVCAAIDELEQAPRSFWTGSIGWHDVHSGACSWNILIRTLEAHKRGNLWHGIVCAGGGITIESKPLSEVAEAKWKASALRKACGWITSEAADIPSGELSIHPVTPETAPKGENCEGEVYWIGDMAHLITSKARRSCGVLLVDNLDSFTYNIAHCVAQLGHDVTVISGRGELADELSLPVELCDYLNFLNPSHIIIGPGPGNPDDSPLSMAIATHSLAGQIEAPLLGVCLGHQAIAKACGHEIIPSPSGPVHGTPRQIHHDGSGIFADMQSPSQFTRYNSLVVKDNPDSPLITNGQENNLSMAARHPDLPIHSVQFHPESVGSPNGCKLLANFLGN